MVRTCSGASGEEKKDEARQINTVDEQLNSRYLMIEAHVWPQLWPHEGTTLVLGDSGATVCLVQKGLLKPEDRVQAEEPKKFSTADGSHLDGGEYGAFLQITLPVQKLCGTKVALQTQDFFYEANIAVPVIISYGYMDKHRCAVVPHLRSLVAWPRISWKKETFPLSKSNLRLSHDPLSICRQTTCEQMERKPPRSV